MSQQPSEPSDADTQTQGLQSQSVPAAPHKALRWSEYSFVYVLLGAIIIPSSLVVSMALILFGLINLNADPWHKNKFLVFLVISIAFLGLLNRIFLQVVE